MHRRTFLAGSAATAAAIATNSGVVQELYPSRPITFINPFPPGGAADVVARPFAAVLEPLLKQPVVIETKAGAAGQVGAQFAATAKPDGYTLLVHIVSISGFAEVDKLYGRPVKFTRDDFIPIARFIADPMVLVVNDQQPYKTLKEFVDDVKKRPNELIFSSSGMHGALHLPTALFMKAAGIQMRHLPTHGGGPAVTALLGNNSQVLVSSIAAGKRQIKAGKARALASFGAQRSPALPDVPTMKEPATTSSSICGSDCSRPRARRTPIVTQAARGDQEGGRRPRSSQAMNNIGQEVAYLDQARVQGVLGRRRQARRRRGARRSARCEADGRREPVRRGSARDLRRDHVAGGAFMPSARGVRGQRRSAVRHAGLARRRHDAEAGRRPDDAVRPGPAAARAATARRSPRSTGPTCRTRQRHRRHRGRRSRSTRRSASS